MQAHTPSAPSSHQVTTIKACVCVCVCVRTACHVDEDGGDGGRDLSLIELVQEHVYPLAQAGQVHTRIGVCRIGRLGTGQDPVQRGHDGLVGRGDARAVPRHALAPLWRRGSGSGGSGSSGHRRTTRSCQRTSLAGRAACSCRCGRLRKRRGRHRRRHRHRHRRTCWDERGCGRLAHGGRRLWGDPRGIVPVARKLGRRGGRTRHRRDRGREGRADGCEGAQQRWGWDEGGRAHRGILRHGSGRSRRRRRRHMRHRRRHQRRRRGPRNQCLWLPRLLLLLLLLLCSRRRHSDGGRHGLSPRTRRHATPTHRHRRRRRRRHRHGLCDSGSGN
jgi:hypothetical protein